MKTKLILTMLGLTLAVGTQAQQQKYQTTIAVNPNDSKQNILHKAAHVVPKPNQLASLKREFIGFVHFGPNTFTRMEWGNGKEDPRIFDLKELHTDQWCQAMKAAGMKMVVFTAKHHDGFVLWQSRYTQHGIMSTGFENGKGDVLKNLAASCKKYGLKLGVYLSPADLFQIENPDGLYGNLSKYSLRTIPRAVEGRPFANKTTFKFNVDDYNEYFLNQLFELLTEYGPIDEVWFDGAHPKRKGNQQYNYVAWKKLIHTLAPTASIFGREDLRWCGNEAGATRSTEWNVIPYSENPDTATHFPDMTDENLGAPENLYKAKFLHYQPAETNTSIREGWFYRDEENQKVRSADDVFDIYERSVGGNSIFLLNIPPNRQGKFSDEDVRVLKEVGNRISQTYNKNLLATAKIAKTNSSIIITAPAPVTLNRLVLQENVAKNGERVVEHALDAWLNNSWVQVARATNIGYKRILRFSDVKSNKFRVRILSSRATPQIVTVAGYFYRTRPPQLVITRNQDGQVNMAAKQDNFGWKPHGQGQKAKIGEDFKIYYTTNGSQPNHQSKLFTTPFNVENVTVKAIAFAGKEQGPIAVAEFGWKKNNWRILESNSQDEKFKAQNAIDGNAESFWKSSAGEAHFMAIDLGTENNITSFVYTPPNKFADGMLQKGTISISNDGKSWQKIDVFEFGNLINDPTPRKFQLTKPVKTQFIRIDALTIAGDKNQLAIAELDFFNN